MKKSLQYVLIMSALGLQSGVLLAQQENIVLEDSARKIKVGGVIQPRDLAEIITAYKESDGYVADRDDSNIQWVLNAIKDPSNEQVNLEWYNKQHYEKIKFLYTACTYSALGLTALAQLPAESQKKYILDAARRGDLETFEEVRDIQAMLVMAGNVEWDADTRELNRFMTGKAQERLHRLISRRPVALKSPDEKSQSNFPVSWWSAGTFTSSSGARADFREMMLMLLRQQYIKSKGQVDVNGLFQDDKFPERYKASFAGSMLHTGPGRFAVAVAPEVVKKQIVDVVNKITRTIGIFSTEFRVEAQLDLLTTQGEYPDAKILNEHEGKDIVMSLNKEIKKNTRLPLYNKIAFAKLLSTPFLASNENDELRLTLEKDITKDMPAEKAKKVKQYLHDKNSRVDVLDAMGFVVLERQVQKIKGEDTRKGIIKVKELQKNVDADKKDADKKRVEFKVDDADNKTQEQKGKIKEIK